MLEAAAMYATLIACLLGTLLGMRHALEPDHLAAVSTLATEQKSARAGLWLGASWGIGHTLALLIIGGSLAVLETQMPVRLADGFEAVVAVMIVALGLRALVRAARLGSEGPTRTHHHGGLAHAHPAGEAHVHVRKLALARWPLLVGAIHGLAGSGAITALVLARLPGVGARLLYIALFGLGSVLGMALLTGVAGVPLRRLGSHPRAAAMLLSVTGAVSVAVGGWWGVLSASRLLA